MPIKEPYPSNLTDAEWKQIEPLVPGPKLFGRPPRYSKRAILDAVFDLVRSGWAWRMLPHDLPPWRMVYEYFMVWRREGLWQRIHDTLRERVRLQSGKKRARTAAILDSQSVEVTIHGGVRGDDAGKKIMGRKRHLLVDTLGLILVVVHSAAVQDRDGAKLVLPILLLRFGWLRCIFGDGGYAGELVGWVKKLLPRRGLRLEESQAQRRGQAPL